MSIKINMFLRTTEKTDIIYTECGILALVRFHYYLNIVIVSVSLFVSHRISC